MFLVDYIDGDHFSGQLLISSVSKCVNNLGGNYLNVELRDASGSIQGKKWEVSANDEAIFVSGNVLQIEGEINKYKETLQLKILSAKNIDINDVDVTHFLKQPPISKEELIARFNKYVSSVKNPDCVALLKYFIERNEEKLFSYPAGVSVHHEYSSGLLVHITTMCKIAEFLAPIYEADYDLLITGVILHDIGKLVELEGPVVYKYSLEGKLLGHISIMVGKIREAADELKITSDIPLLLSHMVLSHHDKAEFGSPVPPLIKEAMLLTMIDNLDSKLTIANKALETVEEGEFTQKIYPLDGRMLYKHK